MNLPATPSNLDVAGLTLIESDYRYFEAGAQMEPVLGARLCTMPGYEDLPAGCIVTRANESAISDNPRVWTTALEEITKAKGSRLARFYLQVTSDALRRELISLGYRPACETGMILDLSTWSPQDNHKQRNLRPVVTEEHWHTKRRLTAAGGTGGPDGYDMRSGRFADFELAKCKAGYMQAFLYFVGNKAAATICVAEIDNVARLKNLLVHPEFRHQGVGHAVVTAIIKQYCDQGFLFVAAYADDSRSAIHIYGRQGLVPVNHQTEWTKRLK